MRITLTQLDEILVLLETLYGATEISTLDLKSDRIEFLDKKGTRYRSRLSNLYEFVQKAKSIGIFKPIFETEFIVFSTKNAD